LQSIAADQRLGVDPVANAQTVVVDYSGPNIAKQMHVGHLRSTIIGDCLARVQQFQGHNVIRQNHFGDWGTQFGRVVLAMWYEATFTAAGKKETLARLMSEFSKASRPKDVAAQGLVVRELGILHQQFIKDDPDGDVYFLPYLTSGHLGLDELEAAYTFVSGVTDHADAKTILIDHPLHGPRALSDLPRLIALFVQNPKAPRNSQEELAWKKARSITLDACNELYARLNVQLADPSIQKEPMERGESFYNDDLPGVVAALRRTHIAQESEGAIVVKVEGFETPLIIQKSDGAFLYGTTDLAAVRFRTERLHANRIIYTHDSRQAQHFSQVFDTARRAGWANGVALEYALFGTMLGEDAKPFKTRSGDTVKLKELLDEAEERALAVVTAKNAELTAAHRQQIAHAVGIGAVKYADLSKDRTSDYMFSWDKMLSFDGNTAPYLQNAYVRVHGIFRKAKSLDIERGAVSEATILLQSRHEAALAKQILRLGEIVNLVGRELKPHHLCAYLYDLATQFHAFFEHCPVLKSEGAVRESRLALCELTGRALGVGLGLLGIEHPEQM
ncbi:MAG TPA: arginine--tRNA ligase, partial [Humisphaera sp.]|nr:arginine--tRNA ligase [Humisphaera sp.]